MTPRRARRAGGEPLARGRAARARPRSAAASTWIDPAARHGRARRWSPRHDLGLQPIDLLYLRRSTATRRWASSTTGSLRHMLDAATRRARRRARRSGYTTRLAGAVTTSSSSRRWCASLRALLLRSRPLRADRPRAAAARRERGDRPRGRARSSASRHGRRARRPGARRSCADAAADAARRPPRRVDGADRRRPSRCSTRAARSASPQAGWGHLYQWRRGAYAGVLARVRRRRRPLGRRGSSAFDDAARRLRRSCPPRPATRSAHAALGQLELLVAAVPIAPRPATPAAYRAGAARRARVAFAAKRARAAGAARARRAASSPRCSPRCRRVLPLTDSTSTSRRSTVDDEVAAMAALRRRSSPGASTRSQAEVERRLDAADGHAGRARRRRRSRRARATRSQAAGKRAARRGRDAHPGVHAVGATRAAELAERARRPATRIAALTASRRRATSRWTTGCTAWPACARSCAPGSRRSSSPTAFGRGEPELTPLQLPYRAGERWLALEFDPATVLDGERLLYTAHFADPLDPHAARRAGCCSTSGPRSCPAREETPASRSTTTGPSSRAAAGMLLVTPARPRRGWRWDDLVGALRRDARPGPKLRAVEPAHVDTTPYARFLPATVERGHALRHLDRGQPRRRTTLAVLGRQLDG